MRPFKENRPRGTRRGRVVSSTYSANTDLDPHSGRYFAYIAVSVAALIGLVIVPFFLSPENQLFYVSEGGPVQVLSAAGYLVVTTSLVRNLEWTSLCRHWYLPLIPLSLCLREMDFHAHFTTYNITKTTLYVSPDVPFWEKAFGVAVFAVLGLAGYLLVARFGRAFLNGLRRLDVTAIAVVASAFSAVASKVLDGAASNLHFLGIIIPTWQLSEIIEEVLELGIPIFMAVAVFSYFDRQRTPLTLPV
jgi:hypothetical protein